MICRWSDLGDVTGPGYYPVHKFGITVEVLGRDIITAQQLGGDPEFRLIDVDTDAALLASEHGLREHRIDRFIR